MKNIKIHVPLKTNNFFQTINSNFKNILKTEQHNRFNLQQKFTFISINWFYILKSYNNKRNLKKCQKENMDSHRSACVDLRSKK